MDRQVYVTKTMVHTARTDKHTLRSLGQAEFTRVVTIVDSMCSSESHLILKIGFTSSCDCFSTFALFPFLVMCHFYLLFSPFSFIPVIPFPCFFFLVTAWCTASSNVTSADFSR